MTQLRPLSAALFATLCSVATAQTVTVERLVSVPQNPTAIATAPGVAHQFYVATKSGRVWVVRGNQVLGAPAIDIRANVREVGENGLLGLAFHPDFVANRRVYLLYTRVGGFGDTVISEFTMTAGSEDTIDPASERVLVGPIPQTTDGHKGGDLAFGPDGMLYAALGDGDAGNALNSPAAQDLASPLGKVLRIDVDVPAPHVPLDNPFVGVPGVEPLVYVLGLRNPWRLSVDPVTNTLFVGDVGASAFEEVSRVAPSQAGANLGWPCKEGASCRPSTACVCPSPTLLDPLYVLPHASGSSVCAITGGQVLRGSDIPRLEGQYVFTDFCSPNVWLLQDPYGTPTLVDLMPEFDPAQQNQVRFVAELGQGPSGELLLANHYSGELWQVKARPGFQLYCTSVPNSSGAAATVAASGSPSIAVASLTLSAAGLPPGAFGFFVASPARGYFPGFGGSQGTLCLDLPIFRWSKRVVQADPNGAGALTTDLTDLPWLAAPEAGETWNFQYWTRDSNPTPTSNLSSAVAVTFAP